MESLKPLELMNKPMKMMLIGVTTVFGLIFLYKFIMGLMFKHFLATQSMPIVYVSTTQAQYSDWQPQVKAAGSIRAINGVDITTEVGGLVKKILFTPGGVVNKDDLLVELNADPDVAQLHALQASAELAKITYNRDKGQFEARAVSKATLDTDEANMKSSQAQVEQQAAVVEKKMLRAPFSGKLGINLVNLGQYLNPGDKVVSLQSLDPVYVDFYVPQQELATVQVGQPVKVTTDTFPGRVFSGKITTVNSAVDVNTRNVEVEATFANPKYELVPGMFTSVLVAAGAPKRYITLPLTAVSFNSYGDIAYVLEKTKEKQDKNTIYTAKQIFVTVGEKRGDQVAILAGIKEHDQVVTAGQMKLDNGSRVIINNSVQPSNNPAPKVTNE